MGIEFTCLPYSLRTLLTNAPSIQRRNCTYRHMNTQRLWRKSARGDKRWEDVNAVDNNEKKKRKKNNFHYSLHVYIIYI